MHVHNSVDTLDVVAIYMVLHDIPALTYCVLKRELCKNGSELYAPPSAPKAEVWARAQAGVL